MVLLLLVQLLLCFEAWAAKPDSERIVNLVRPGATSLTISPSENVSASKTEESNVPDSTVRTLMKRTEAPIDHLGIQAWKYFVSRLSRCDENAWKRK
jgi:hypothetical protein